MPNPNVTPEIVSGWSSCWEDDVLGYKKTSAEGLMHLNLNNTESISVHYLDVILFS